MSSILNEKLTTQWGCCGGILGPLKIVKLVDTKQQFEVELDVPNFYEPHEIDVKIVEHDVKINCFRGTKHGSHESSKRDEHKYRLPEDVDLVTVKHHFSPTGGLILTAMKKH